MVGEQVHPHLGQGAGVGVAQFVEADLRFDLGRVQASGSPPQTSGMLANSGAS